jgi:hypothetical protein
VYYGVAVLEGAGRCNCCWHRDRDHREYDYFYQYRHRELHQHPHRYFYYYCSPSTTPYSTAVRNTILFKSSLFLPTSATLTIFLPPSSHLLPAKEILADETSVTLKSALFPSYLRPIMLQPCAGCGRVVG